MYSKYKHFLRSVTILLKYILCTSEIHACIWHCIWYKNSKCFSRFKIPLILLISKYKVKLKRRLTQPLHIVALKYLQCTFKESVVYISLATHQKKKFCDKWLLLCFHLHYFLKVSSSSNRSDYCHDNDGNKAPAYQSPGLNYPRVWFILHFLFL